MASAAAAETDKTLDDHLTDALVALAAIDLRTIKNADLRARVKDARDSLKLVRKETKAAK